MDNQDIRTLKILEEIDNDHTPSQRDLSRKLNISLGLVNSFIKRLAQKGYFKVTNIPANRVKYILTPEGAAEKTRLTYEYIQYSFEFYKRSRKELRRLFQDLMSKNIQSIIFYGATDLAEIAYVSLQETPIKLKTIVDKLKIGDKFLGGIIIEDPSEIKLLPSDWILITAMDSKNEVLESLLEKGISRNKVVVLE
ncbi:winged helix-turn-helix transcriptional regulator [Thermodesulfobacteriota bacterium]